MNLVARVGEKIWGIFANFQKKGVEKNRDWHDWSILLPKMDQHKNQFVYVFFSLGEAKKSEVLGWCYICNDNPNCTKLSA